MQTILSPLLWPTANLTRSLLSNYFLSAAFLRTKKGESSFCFASLAYGCFLSVRIASTTPIMTITIITAAIPNSRLEVDAKPVTGAAVGAGVGAAGVTVKDVSAEDPQYEFVLSKLA